ncbi:hypothetical protein QO588_003609 [Salmonella enterica]|nr:hypothetical protein [Salmonella enterica]EGZ4032497.1 hypothetical protein [Salmonella enterica subsp. enterica serovar Javiana]HCX7090120.1 hypothetical protein [Salmonella enterica subsp. enterica]ECE1413800.1 hypothetical protein [Salmonella enterica]ELS7235289.1 hypothetical protein [Salmonella enterica]
MQNGKNYYGIQVNLSEIEVEQNTVNRLKQLTNNLGDCYNEKKCPLPNTMSAERKAVEMYGEWLNLPIEESWGYIGGGSSIGNLQGMWMARTLYPDATLVFSESAHYSIYKYSSLLNFKSVIIINTLQDGSIDINDLKRKIHREMNIVIVLTSGTTMTSAHDDVDNCIEVLNEMECTFYLHLDAALGGSIIPFISQGELGQKPSDFTFSNKNISSMTISIHKIIGVPVPANIFISRLSVVERFKSKVNEVPYLSHIKDITIYGSRDGFRAELVYKRINSLGWDGVYDIVQSLIKNCNYLLEGLKRLGLSEIFRVSGGVAIVIPVESLRKFMSYETIKDIEKRFHLVRDDENYHIYVMQHMYKKDCDEIVSVFRSALL